VELYARCLLNNEIKWQETFGKVLISECSHIVIINSCLHFISKGRKEISEWHFCPEHIECNMFAEFDASSHLVCYAISTESSCLT